ncbi:MAG: ABC transporter ATP-binding protein [Nitratireductor sp.]|nr:ABC transporter ATP-binding protein [Nitratireductor sp.]
MSDPYLRLESLRKSYDGVTMAVDTISLDVAKGEFVTFVGPSGSGKTSTLMMIAGFEQPNSGKISIRGTALDVLPPYKRNIGMVFQNYALFPHMTILKNVGFPLKMRGVDSGERDKKAAAALDMVGLNAFMSRRPREMSGGQQQRVALARALVFEPDLLLLDEPLGALDKNLREQMQLEIVNLQKSLGITAIYVTHDQSEAMTLSDRVAVFNNGKIEQIDTPLNVYRTPSSLFVAEFFGDCNVLSGKMVSTRERAVGLDCGMTVALERLGQSFQDGEKVSAIIRPEDVRLAPKSAKDLSLQLHLNHLIDYGSYILALCNLDQVPVRIRCEKYQRDLLEPGKDIKAFIAPEDIWIVSK